VSPADRGDESAPGSLVDAILGIFSGGTQLLRVISRLRRSPSPVRALFLSLFALALALPAQAQSEERPSIVLLPIVVHSSESPQYLRRGLADMMASRFEQGGLFRVIRIDDPALATTRIPVALEAAREVGGDFVLFGSFTRFGAGASLDMQAAATAVGEDGETLREIFVHSGSIGEVIPDLVDLVGKVTRFASTDYVPPAPGSAVPAARAPSGSSGSVADLRKRVEALERAILRLEEAQAAAE
jgi:hypothetical protein